MKLFRTLCLLLVALPIALLLQAPIPQVSIAQAADGPATSESSAVAPAASIPPPATVAEARARAQLLFEMIHGTLQVVHRDFFEEDDALAIPSASLEDVFHELSVSYDVKLKWLVVNADALNVDHQPSDAFEKQAVESLAAGKPLVETTENGRYRFAGPIRLPSQCLKCHVKRRTTNTDRTAGLLISMPLQAAAAEPKTP